MSTGAGGAGRDRHCVQPDVVSSAVRGLLSVLQASRLQVARLGGHVARRVPVGVRASADGTEARRGTGGRLCNGDEDAMRGKVSATQEPDVP